MSLTSSLYGAGVVHVGSELPLLGLWRARRHGSTVRQIPGARRNVLISYGPDRTRAWQAPADVFERLPPATRALIAPEPAKPEGAAAAKL